MSELPMDTHIVPNKVLDSVINNDNFIDLTDSIDRSTRSTLFQTDLPPILKKRKIQDFLDDYHKKIDPVTILSSDEEEEEEETETETERGPEVKEALDKLEFSLSTVLQNHLKLHQIEGLDFMWDRIYNKKQGCLLAHSMGLGKTMQVISLLTTMYQYLKRHPETHFPTGKRVLILAPLITLTNWEYEFEKWAVSDSESVIGEVYNITSVSGQYDGRKRFIKHWFTHGGVLLMNYDRFSRLLSSKDTEAASTYHTYLVNPGADIVVLDEAHRIKSSTSMISHQVQKIRTRSRICMTGYPLQNHLIEYYYMIDFIAPGLLGSVDEFKTYFALYIENCYSDSSKAVKSQAAFKLYVLQLLTNNVTHRRDDLILKKDLPSKTEYLIKFKLTPVQHTGYMSLLGSPNIVSVLSGLAILRSLCNHPKIFESFVLRRNEQKKKELFDRMEEDADDEDFVGSHQETRENNKAGETEEKNNAEETEVRNGVDTVDNDSTEDDEHDVLANWTAQELLWAKNYLDTADIESWKCSGKISFIIDLANECKLVGDKLCIVSHSLACLNYIQHLFPVFGIKHSRLDGSVLAAQRQHIIDTFNNTPDINVMLLSAKASAIGINVTSANRIILVDQDWNPLYDEQSIGRVYRYGQEKPVFVYRLMTHNTIEERIYLQSKHKRSISKRVIDNKPTNVISKEELVKYFQVPEENPNTIEDIPEGIDWVTSSALSQNKELVTEIEVLDQQPLQDTSFQIVPMHMRDRAKHEALRLLKNWKYKNRTSLSTPS